MDDAGMKFVPYLNKVYEDNRSMQRKYEIVDRIGQGAFGQVYKVQEKCTKEAFAAKTIRIGPNGIPENPFREMKAMQELQHPHVGI